MNNKRNKAKLAAIRMIHMILAVPTDGWVKTGDVHRQVLAAGYKISKVSICRDLKSCAGEFGIECRRMRFGEDYSWTRSRGLE